MSNCIDLAYLVAYFQQQLGDKFCVSLNNQITPRKDNIVDVTLRAQSVPFSMPEVKSETLNVDLNFRVNVRNTNAAETLNSMRALQGYKEFTIQTYVENGSGEIVNGALYNVVSFFNAEKPIGNPEVDSGELMSDYLMTGTILVTDSESGAIMSNSVDTYLGRQSTFSDAKKLSVVSLESQLNFDAEPSVLSGAKKPIITNKSHALSYAIRCLNLDSAIDGDLIRNLELAEPSETLDVVYYMWRIYPGGSGPAHKVKLIGGGVSEAAGAYQQYSINLQVVD